MSRPPASTRPVWVVSRIWWSAASRCRLIDAARVTAVSRLESGALTGVGGGPVIQHHDGAAVRHGFVAAAPSARRAGRTRASGWCGCRRRCGSAGSRHRGRRPMRRTPPGRRRPTGAGADRHPGEIDHARAPPAPRCAPAASGCPPTARTGRRPAPTAGRAGTGRAGPDNRVVGLRAMTAPQRRQQAADAAGQVRGRRLGDLQRAGAAGSRRVGDGQRDVAAVPGVQPGRRTRWAAVSRTPPAATRQHRYQRQQRRRRCPTRSRSRSSSTSAQTAAAIPPASRQRPRVVSPRDPGRRPVGRDRGPARARRPRRGPAQPPRGTRTGPAAPRRSPPPTGGRRAPRR